MKAIRITEPGGPEVMRLVDVPTPEPLPGGVRVRVAATAVNRADLLQRAGHYRAPDGWPADIPGLEYAGVVDAVGPGVTGVEVGDRVMGLVGGGAYAEYVVVPAGELVRVPEGLGLEVAAAVPEVFITAHDALRVRLRLARDERLLIHAVGSGVGTAALQLAGAWGARTLGTSRTAWKLERAAELGLDVGIDAGEGRFADRVLAATGGRGVDAVLDLVGGAYLGENLRSLATLGRQVVVGLTAGRRAELDLGVLLRKRLTLVGTVLRSRPPAERVAAARGLSEEVVPLLAARRIRPVIHATLPVSEAARAHELVASDGTFGKVVLSW